ncbi:putative OmpR family two-component response regulator [Gordonia araii NBRC 100433]|uniref:Putative OmpR family two-component response regulator n=1 Tax=Gordonia araii NBRC 100433 TaxID=1073574 RepID=G7GYU4_9ACTN|nr:response regulator transcription factor [Gordonia araii]NNG96979.1 response regulator transcription factor [Gordonia araii NBRC 100433]GAB08769.1 putative OmpR family two-component response regulator [Gordonia araii NBRC 100433]
MNPTGPQRGSLGLKALVVEDETDLAALLSEYLTRGGFDVEVQVDGEAAVDAAQTDPPDLVVLDLGLPSIDGIEVCRRLRTFTDAYVVMVTARADEVDKLIGLSVGADDYVTKPFSPRELMARIDALFRRPRSRMSTDEAPTDERRFIGGLTIDPQAREVTVDSKLITLTAKEFDLLDALASSPRLVFRRTDLIERVWGSNWVANDHLVDVHIASLRRKLGDSATSGRYIRTVRGVGYRMGSGE